MRSHKIRGSGDDNGQLLDKTAPKASKSWQRSHEPLRRTEEGQKGTRHTEIIYTEETREGRAGTTQKQCSNVEYQSPKGVYLLIAPNH